MYIKKFFNGPFPLILIWILLFVSHLYNLEWYGQVAFIIIALPTILISSFNSVLLLLILLYNPSTTLNIPYLYSFIIFFVFLATIARNQSIHFRNNFVLSYSVFIVSCLFIFLLNSNVGFQSQVDYLIDIITNLFLALILFGTISKGNVENFIGKFVVIASAYLLVSLSIFYYGTDAYIIRLVESAAQNSSLVDRFNTQFMENVRVMSPTSDPNFLALKFIIPLFFSLFLVKKSKNSYYYIFSALLLIQILLTFSRSAFVSVVIGIILYVFYDRNLGIKLKTVSVSIISGVGIIYFNNSLMSRISSISQNIISRGGSGRFEAMSEGLDIYFSNPITGVGLGNLQFISTGELSAHNTFLELLVSGGFILFVPFVVLILLVFWKINTTSLNFGTVLIPGFIAYVAMINTISVFDYSQIIILFVITQRYNGFISNINS